MAKGSRHRFQSPPPEDPISAVRDSSLAFRLNFGFFFRQLMVFLMMDLLLFGMAAVGLCWYGESRCAGVAALVEERGVPSADALPPPAPGAAGARTARRRRTSAAPGGCGPRGWSPREPPPPAASPWPG